MRMNQLPNAPLHNALRKAVSRAREQDGVTMIIAMGVMLVTSLLLTASFLAARGDINLSHTDTAQKEAYYAAVAGVQQFEYQMQINPDYWETCGEPTKTVALPKESGSSYKVKILPAGAAKECSTANPFGTVIESSGTAANTFRIESIGYSGNKSGQHHAIVATFKVKGFLNFIYYTNHEDEDPSLYEKEASTECKNPNTYYPNTSECQLIQFATGDEINGPMHTNDAPCVGGSASFGRSGESPPDVIEFYRGLNAKCSGTGKYNTATKNYIKGELLPPPTSDASLETYANEEDTFSGVTVLELNGLSNTITVTNKEEKKTIAWPTNGLIYVKSSGACEYEYQTHNSDNREEAKREKACGNVYVSGTFGSSLTIGSADDVIIDGEIYPYGNKGGEPTGTATVGLIANNFVRVYHPVGETYEVGHKVISAHEPPVSGEICGKLVKRSSELKNNSEKVKIPLGTAELSVGMEVSGKGIAAGAKITEIKSASKEITLSKKATETVTAELTFISVSGLEYNENLNECIEKSPFSSWKLSESPLEYHESCNSPGGKEEKYAGKGLCEYTDNAKECDAPSLTKAGDTLHGWGSMENPWIYAGILATTHSFAVDNYNCGETQLGYLHVYGAIAQNYRGIVGTVGATGYLKDYKYDNRLAVDEPPYFLSPLNAGWKVARQTSITGG
jgi:hypothetical protein